MDTVFFEIKKVREAVEEMDGSENGFGSKFKANFQVDEKLKAQVFGRFMKLVSFFGGSYTFVYSDSTQATHVKFERWTMSNVSFFGKGARSDKSWNFADTFFAKLSKIDSHNMTGGI